MPLLFNGLCRLAEHDHTFLCRPRASEQVTPYPRAHRGPQSRYVADMEAIVAIAREHHLP